MQRILDRELAVDKDGWMQGVRRAPTPNQDARPDGAVVELVVVHGISLPPGEFGGPWIERFFDNALPSDAHPYFAQVRDRRVSAHLLVRRGGESVQFVSFDRRAWHAGESSWCERADCNDFSVGIELEGTDEVPYTDTQYATLAAAVRALQAAYPGIAGDAVVGHADIAPGRKTDPGHAFDWARLRRLMRA